MVSRLAGAGLTAIELDVLPARLPLLKAIVIFVATLCERLVKVTKPLTDATLVAPWSVPLPALRVAVTTVPLSPLRRLPYWSSIRSTGCWAKGSPTAAVAEGWLKIVSRLAAAGLTSMLDEAAPLSPALAKFRVIVSATL